MYSKKGVSESIDSIKKSISQVEKNLFETKHDMIEDLDLSKIEEERKYEAVKKRLLQLNTKMKNLEDLKIGLNKKINSINRKMVAAQNNHREVINRVRVLEREKKKLPVIKKGITDLRSDRDRHLRKVEKIRVMLDQLSLIIKETRMQESQLKKLNKKLERMKKKLI